MRSGSSRTISEIIEDHVPLLFGVPKTILIDNGNTLAISLQNSPNLMEYGLYVLLITIHKRILVNVSIEH